MLEISTGTFMLGILIFALLHYLKYCKIEQLKLNLGYEKILLNERKSLGLYLGSISELTVNDLQDAATANKLSKELDTHLDNYLRQLDLVSYHILNGNLKESYWKENYCTYLDSVVKNYPDKFNALNTKYGNVLTLWKKWNYLRVEA